MLSKMKRMFQKPTPSPYPNYNQPGMNYGQPNPFDVERFRTEMNEINRSINELGKRVTRLEGYLGIRSDQ